MLGLQKSMFRATPRQLMISLLIDTLFLVFLQPSTPTAIWVYIIFLPGFDLVSAIGSYWNYVQDYRKAQHD